MGHKLRFRYFVISDILEYGAYTQTLYRAQILQKLLIDNGGNDARIEYDLQE